MILERMPSPVGELVLLEENGTLIGLAFGHRWARVHADIERHRGRLPHLGRGETRARPLLEAYFSGKLEALSEVQWAAKGTVFQEQVWSSLPRIPVGQTWSYKELAAAVGRPSSVRAVANAVGANPVSIAVPCHRVIGANGRLTGFGGGLGRKSWLLAHEGVDG